MGECVKRVPEANFIYFADNFNVPYGNYCEKKILLLADKVFAEIEKYKPCAAVIACNTVTAVCAGFLRKKYSFPIIGIQPAVKPAAKTSGKCVVLATPATAQSSEISELVEHFGKGVTEVVACKDLASYIENNIFDLKREVLLNLLPDINADSIVLGCTHYIYIKQIVKEKYHCAVFDGMCGTAKRLRTVLGYDNGNEMADHANKNIESDAGYISKVVFKGGDEWKNERIFNEIIMGL